MRDIIMQKHLNPTILAMFFFLIHIQSCNTLPEISFEPIRLPQTGQTTSYYPGDDGALQRGVKWPNPRFINHGNGAITDRLTGLMWEAMPRKQHVDWYQAFDRINELNREKLGGFSDWRMPNINELVSILNWSGNNPIEYLEKFGFNLQDRKSVV